MKKSTKVILFIFTLVLAVLMKFFCINSILTIGYIPAELGIEYGSYLFNAVLFVMAFMFVDKRIREPYIKFLNAVLSTIIYLFTLLWENCFYNYFAYNHRNGWADPINYSDFVNSNMVGYSKYALPEYHWPVLIMIVAFTLICLYNYYKADVQAKVARVLLDLADETECIYFYELVIRYCPYGITRSEFISIKENYMRLLCYYNSVNCMDLFSSLDKRFAESNEIEEYDFEYRDNSKVSAANTAPDTEKAE